MNLHGIFNKGQGRRLVARPVAMLAVIGVAMLGGIATAATASAGNDSHNDAHKVWVCKYVGTPFVNETLKDGKQPISVDEHSTDGTGVGGYFNDQHGQSFVLALVTRANTGKHNSYIGGLECPLPREPKLTHLTLVKEVVGSDVSPSLWTLHAGDFAGTSGTTFDAADGVYKLSETGGPENYTSPGWKCDNSEGYVTQVTIGHIDAFVAGVPTGVTCTITNTYVPPPPTHKALLTLVKFVDNRGGGSAHVTDWTLDATGGPTAFAEGKTGVHQQVADGTYTLSESTGPANYSPSLWLCSNNIKVKGTTVVIGSNDRFVICAITNTYVPPPPTTHLTLVKRVVGSDVSPSLWTLHAGDFAGPSETTFDATDGTYNLSETGGPTNYTSPGWTCSNSEGFVTQVTIGRIESDSFAKVEDQGVTCTITNTYVPPPPTITESIPVTPPTFTPGSCTADGSVVATETAGYTWVSAGPAKARSYQALAKSGYTLTAPALFGPYDLSKLAADSVECPAAPEVLGVVKNAPVKAPVVAGVVKSAPVKTLAFTGADPVPLGLSGLLALLLGAALTVASRQRPKKARE